ncbi:GAF domain-containing protein [Arsukibacterium sp.]|uniref:GAF domain-containing protein n=1 Tax=Arsukibacterium sp. TaxID=1977258 RepID=UPI001BD5526A|nr:GAF domain-containing protein [Arsukibacterium sp.]
MQAFEYLQRSGLLDEYGDISAEIERVRQALTDYLQTASGEVHWQFQVPELGEGGACSLFGQLAAEPYSLLPILGGQTAANQTALSKLSAITDYYQENSGQDWFGIYQARSNPAGEPVLVKLAYYGAPSRPEFPLNSEFAKISNNSTVGLSGRARVINSVPDYLAAGGEYYTCDPKVQAEACLPLFDQSGKIAGIVDAEHFQQAIFTPAAMALLVAVCLVVPKYLP